MNGRRLLWKAAAVGLLANAQLARALVFKFVPATGTPQNVIDGFTLAGSRWSANLSDDITVRVSIHFSPLASGVLGETDAPQLSNSYSSIRSRLSSHATSVDDTQAIAHLPLGSAVDMLINRTSNSPNGSG